MKIKKINYNFILFAILLALFSFFFNFYFGFKGVNLIDSFQTFDSGFRVLNGDLPFKDYYSRDGAILDIIQALFFKTFGANWTSFVINASLVNALFSISVFYYGLFNNIDFFRSFFYAAVAGILLYPPAGTPQIDHHALAFSFISFYIFLKLCDKQKRFPYLFFIPIFYGLIFFIKPVPTVFFIIGLIIKIFLYDQKFIKTKLFYLTLGSVIFFLGFFLIVQLNKIPIKNIYEQLTHLTLHTGVERLTIQNLKNLFFSTLKIKYLMFLILPFCYTLLLARKKNKGISKDNYLFIAFFFIIILHESYTANQTVTISFLSILSILLSKILINQNLNYNKTIKSILFFIVILVLIRIFRQDILIFGFVLSFTALMFFFKFHKKNINLVIFFTVILTVFYFNKIILTRFWLDIYNPDWNNSFKGEKIDKKLDGLVWLSNNNQFNKEFEEIVYNLKFLKEIDESYIIITHLQIYNVILEKKNFSPVKYWWNNATYPITNTKAKKEFDIFFINKINKNNIKKIIVLNDVVNEHTGNFQIEEFKWLSNCVKKNNEKNINGVIYDITKSCSLK